MSRINADVIDVLENRKTRLQILDINGEDAEEVLSKSRLYLHYVQLWTSGDEAYNVSIPIYSCDKNPAITLAKLSSLFKNKPNTLGINLPIPTVSHYKVGGVDYKDSMIRALLNVSTLSSSIRFIISLYVLGENGIELLTTRTLNSDTHISDNVFEI